jgi:DNA-binding GntR family transcriptional regulator
LAIEFKASLGLAEQIAEYLGSRIIHLEIKPGERILEAKLASEMGVSRAPLREALRILEMNGLIDILPRRGARVSEMSENSIIGLNDVLKEVLGLVAQRGVENGTMEDFEKVRVAGQALEEYAEIEDISGYLNATLQFARASCRATKNSLLEKVVLFLWPLTSRMQYASLITQKNGLKKNVEYFQLAQKYYLEGKADMAAKVIRELVENETMNAIKFVRGKGYVNKRL